MIGFIKYLFGIKPKPQPKPQPKPRKPTNRRISVHLHDGRTIVHYGMRRELHADGTLSIFGTGKTQDGLVADYPQGAWVGVSVGKRHVSGVRRA